MTRNAMLADLKRSGLTSADARKAAYKVLTRKQTQDLTGYFALSYRIPYHDVNGECSDFCRFRFLEEIRRPFGAIKEKPLRYAQPAGTLPRLYFPKRVDWARLAIDTSEPLIITEGEKKAEKACKDSLPCIAIGGVWAWRSKRRGIPAISDFDVIRWEGRTVYLCFDNDLMTNPLVLGALNALAHELTDRGGKVEIKFLPDGPDKIGLDDYLVTHPASSFARLRCEIYAESAALWTLNERIAYIEELNKLWDFETQKFYKTQQDYRLAFGNLKFKVRKPSGDGFVEKLAIEEWIKWPYRRHYRGVGYFPGEGPVVDNCVNTWTPFPIEPSPGDVVPFHDLIDFLFEGELELKMWFYKWLAYPLQNPGAKLMQAVLLHSRAQGVGKTFVGEIIGQIYGDNFNVVSQDELHSQFNEWLVSKQFILGEELSGSNSRRDADRLKNMFTRKIFNVNIKFQPSYRIADRANYLLTSNRVDALFLDDDDRRAMVHEIKAKAKPESFYKRIANWLENGGASHLFHHLLNEVDTSDFNSRGHAPMTVSKQSMIDLSKSDVDIWAAALVKNPNEVLRLGDSVVDRDLFTATEIVAFASRKGERQPSKIATSKALARVGIRPRQIGTHKGTKLLWPLRNFEEWAVKADSEWKDHYREHDFRRKFSDE